MRRKTGYDCTKSNDIGLWLTVSFIAVTEVDDVVDGRVEHLEEVVEADQRIDPLKLKFCLTMKITVQKMLSFLFF